MLEVLFSSLSIPPSCVLGSMSTKKLIISTFEPVLVGQLTRSTQWTSRWTSTQSNADSITKHNVTYTWKILQFKIGISISFTLKVLLVVWNEVNLLELAKRRANNRRLTRRSTVLMQCAPDASMLLLFPSWPWWNRFCLYDSSPFFTFKMKSCLPILIEWVSI